MASRDRVELTVTFGPTSSPLLSRARSYATAHATTSAEIAPGVWRAAFTLQGDPEPYGRAYRLLGRRPNPRGALRLAAYAGETGPGFPPGDRRKGARAARSSQLSGRPPRLATG